jgi:ArsR family transcriptional regulator
MAPLVRTETDEVRSMIAFRTSSIYEMMLSLGALHLPSPRHERWSQQVRAQLPGDLLEDIDFLYSRFENGVLLLELAVDFPDHHDVPGFLAHLAEMPIPTFLFYALGRLVPVEQMAELEPNIESLLSIIPFAFPEGSSKTEQRFRSAGFVDLVADPEASRGRMLRVWRRYWESYFAQEVTRYTQIWEDSVLEKSRALSSQDGLEFVKRLSAHEELPEQIPQGYPTQEILLVPSFFARRQLMFYGYGSVTIIYDCQLTEQRRAQMQTFEDEVVAVAKALSEKTRLQLLRLIAQDPQLYGRELSKLCHVSQPSVSRHLRILKQSGLLEERPSDNRITYQVVRQRIEDLAPRLTGYLYEEE